MLAPLLAAAALLLHDPAVSKTHVVFSYGNDLWLAPLQGGDARPLTTGAGVKSHPVFSPDGRLLAFAGDYDGNTDVYVLPVAGGEARRLTFHPAEDVPVAFTPDGKRILFRSPRKAWSPRLNQLFTVAIDGGLPEQVPLPSAEQGSYSPGGERLAYVPVHNAEARIAWKRYRGGKAARIWLADLSDSRIEKIPREGSNDSSPMWMGNEIYFLSDRDGPTTLYSFDPVTKAIKKVVPGESGDILSASAGDNVIVFEKLTGLYLYDVSTHAAKPLPVRVASDLPAVRKRFVKVGDRIVKGALSPSGARAVFEARGDIFTVPAEKGDVRNLTKTPGAAERDPAWSPDGKWIAYFSDEGGEYALHLKPLDGGKTRHVDLGLPPSFFYAPTWSPDNKRIACTDKRLALWVHELDKGDTIRIDADSYETPGQRIEPAWSPDGQWLAYSRQLANRMHALFAWSVHDRKSTQLTDGMSDAQHPAFDESGKYLYFTASTDAGPSLAWLDMSAYRRPVSASVYVVVLRKDLPSPLEHESDEEKGSPSPLPKKEEKKQPEKKEPFRIDFDNLSQRILALPLPPRNYTQLKAGKAGIVFIAEAPLVRSDDPMEGETLQRFDLSKRKPEKLAEGIQSFDLSADGSKLLLGKHKKWSIAPSDAPIKPDHPHLRTSEMEAELDPRAEWQQEFREVWRIERDYFYDPGLHGLSLVRAMEQYQPYLSSLASRRDLQLLFRDMLGELSVGHLFIASPPPAAEARKGGLLGADYRVEGSRYRIDKIYQGDNWNPGLRAPLTEPAVNAAVGDYLLAIDGRELTSNDDVDDFLQGTADKQIQLKLARSAGGEGARTVLVVPVANEIPLRQRAWMEANRRKVAELSQNKLAYVYLPNTAGGGFTNFNRYYFAQADKLGLVIDERFNGGGLAADYIIEQLRRPLLNHWVTREGKDFSTPASAIFGPKAMIINEWAGSGGDALPWYFRRAKIGPLIGQRTWGGLVGIYDYPQLIGGGSITAPRVAFYSPESEWDVENKGVAPDIESELTPQAWRQGRDLQLEKAIEWVLDELKKQPASQQKRPAFPNYH